LRHEDVASISERVTSVFDEIAAAVPHTPLALLSPLASGADTLVAEIALSRGMKVVACLPMPVEDYLADFPGDDAQRFLALLDRCSRVVVLRGKPQDEADRVNGYAAAGSYVALSSNTLLALWDGADSEGVGGTADVVHKRISGAPTMNFSAFLDPPDVGPVYWIATPRASNPTIGDPFAVQRLYPESLDWDEAGAAGEEQAALARLDMLNRDLAGSSAGVESGGAIASVLTAIDRVASRLQRRRIVVSQVLYVLAFIAASAQVALEDDVRSTAIKFALLGIALVVFLYARRSNVQGRYEDYRALAEGLRVQEAWRSAGIDANADRHYLRTQAGELQWIRRALSALAVVSDDRAAADPGAAVAEWIEDQKAYYTRATGRASAIKTRVNVSAMTLTLVNLVAGALVALVLFVPYPPLASFVALHGQLMHSVLPLLIAWAALSAGLLAAYANERGFAEAARRYTRTGLLFARAERQLRLHADLKGLALELGRESLAEHADWLLSQRARPLTVTKT
jgi:hypothetical protein